MTSPTGAPRVPIDRLTLDDPRSLVVYDTYEDAQRAVDYLSDHEFPVQNVLIVGTDLKQVERVTGRLTWGKVIAGGLASGMWLGAFVGLIFTMLGEGGSAGMFLSVVLTGALFGVVWASLGYALTRGRRDFTSVSQVVATRYEVLVEQGQFDRAREMLANLPGGRGRMAAPASSPSARPNRPNPYEGLYGIRTDEQGRPIDPAARGGAADGPAPAVPRPAPEGRSASTGASAVPRPDAPGEPVRRDHAPRHAAPTVPTQDAASREHEHARATDRHPEQRRDVVGADDEHGRGGYGGPATGAGAAAPVQRVEHGGYRGQDERDESRERGGHEAGNGYEGRYGVRLPEGQTPPPVDEDAAPPNPRD